MFVRLYVTVSDQNKGKHVVRRPGCFYTAHILTQAELCVSFTMNVRITFNLLAQIYEQINSARFRITFTQLAATFSTNKELALAMRAIKSV